MGDRGPDTNEEYRDSLARSRNFMFLIAGSVLCPAIIYAGFSIYPYLKSLLT